MKILRKKNYDKLMRDLEYYKEHSEIIEKTLEITDTQLCENRKAKYDLEKALDFKCKKCNTLTYVLETTEKQLREQKNTNRRLIHYLFGPKIK